MSDDILMTRASGTIGKFLRENRLLPEEKYSLYSIRHTFKDRLRDVEAPEEIINELMEHHQSGPKYGRGRRLKDKHRWLQAIAFNLPKTGGVSLS